MVVKKDKQQLSPQEKQKLDGERKLKKAAKFKELAGKRVARAMHAIRQVERLSNRGSYVYTQDQAGRILIALTNSLRAVDAAFKRTQEAPKAAAFDVGD